jgi:hypothetical protein
MVRNFPLHVLWYMFLLGEQQSNILAPENFSIFLACVQVVKDLDSGSFILKVCVLHTDKSR